MSVGESAETAGRREGVDGALLAVVAASLLVVAAGAVVQVRYGSFPMTLDEALAALFDTTVLFDHRWLLKFALGESLMRSVTGFRGELPELATGTVVVWTIRLPRVVAAVVVGANLAASGAIFQAVTRNELASPYVLGVSSGAGLAVLLTLVVFSGLNAYLPVVAALGGAAAFVLVYAIAWQNGTSPVRLVLAGVVVSTVFTSLQHGTFYFAEDLGVVQSAIAWTTGSLTGVEWRHVRPALPWSIAATCLALVSARQLNVLALGEQTARSLGMAVERTRFLLAGVAVLAAAASIAVAGIVGFVGLLIPHVVRNVVGSDYKRLMVGCLFAGPALMVAADVVARLALPVGQVPVGIVTGVLGGPYFLYLMRRQQDVGEL